MVREGGCLLCVDKDGETAEAVRMCVMHFMCSTDFQLRRDSSLVFLSVLSCECVDSCGKHTTDWMTIGGQCHIAAEYYVLSYSQVHVSSCVGVRLYMFFHCHTFIFACNESLTAWVKVWLQEDSRGSKIR